MIVSEMQDPTAHMPRPLLREALPLVCGEWGLLSYYLDTGFIQQPQWAASVLGVSGPQDCVSQASACVCEQCLLT